MPEWLTTSLNSAPNIPLGLLTWRIAIATILGLGVSAIYRFARRGEVISATFVTTLILLSTVIAMATQVIGDNVARAFSLVGALSVVRFRTVVKDTQDTVFVIFAVVVGMSSGANQLGVALVGMLVILGAALFLWPPRKGDTWHGIEGKLAVRLANREEVRSAVEHQLTARLLRSDLISVHTARQGASLDLTYLVRLRPGASPVEIVSGLGQIEGLESVELDRED